MNTTDQATLEALAERLGVLLRSAGQTVATAESCTGGWVGWVQHASEELTPGSPAWYDRGFVTYSYASKSDLLGVPAQLIATRGAVSEAVALAMADGALSHSVADWSVAITGIAGPDGGTPDKPVGTVCFAWAGRDGMRATRTCCFVGHRAEVRAQAVATALTGLIERAGRLLA